MKRTSFLGVSSRRSCQSVQFSCSVMSDSLLPHEPQHARPPCSSPTPRVYPNSCPLSWWCHPTISSSVIPFSSCPQSFPATGSFQMSQLFASGGQSIGVSASTSVLPINTSQLQLLQHYWWGNRLGLLWYWMVCLGNEQRSFCHFWDSIQVLHFELLLTIMATSFLLRDSCPQ